MMADVGPETCPFFGKQLTSASDRSRSTHVGMCRAKAIRSTQALKRKREEEDEEEDGRLAKLAAQDGTRDDEREAREEGPPDVETPEDEPKQGHMFSVPLACRQELNKADEALLRLYRDRKDLSCSLLDDILPICRQSPPTQFGRSATLLKFIDALPGPEFRTAEVVIPTNPEPFPYAYRDICDVVQEMIRQHNGTFFDPMVAHGGFVYGGEYVHGTRYRELQASLAKAAGPNAVLMPLILSSGLCNTRVHA